MAVTAFLWLELSCSEQCLEQNLSAFHGCPLSVDILTGQLSFSLFRHGLWDTSAILAVSSTDTIIVAFLESTSSSSCYIKRHHYFDVWAIACLFEKVVNCLQPGRISLHKNFLSEEIFQQYFSFNLQYCCTVAIDRPKKQTSISLDEKINDTQSTTYEYTNRGC